MIEILEQTGNLLCLQASGKLTHADYEQVINPTPRTAHQRARQSPHFVRHGRRVRTAGRSSNVG